MKEEVLGAILRNDKPMSLGAAEIPHLPLYFRVGDGYLTPTDDVSVSRFLD